MRKYLEALLDKVFLLSQLVFRATLFTVLLAGMTVYSKYRNYRYFRKKCDNCGSLKIQSGYPKDMQTFWKCPQADKAVLEMKR